MQVAARGQVTYLYAEYGQDKSIVRSRWYTINGSDSLVETGESGSYYTTKTLAMQYINLAGNIALVFNGFKFVYDSYLLTYRGFGVSELDTQYTILRTFLYDSGLGDESPEFGEDFDWEQYSVLLTAYEDAEKRVNDNISRFLKSKIDEKIDRDDVNYLVNALSSDDTVISGGVVLGSFIGVKDGSSVVAAINASSSITGFYDDSETSGHGVLMIAAGISDISTAKTTSAFRVFEDGYVYAENANISGDITATGGTIGGWTIGDNSLSSGASTTFVSLNSNSSVDYAMWAGAQVAANAPFSVTKAGALTATSGTIGGFEINASGLGKEIDDSEESAAGTYLTVGGFGSYNYDENIGGFFEVNTHFGRVYSSGKMVNMEVKNSVGDISFSVLKIIAAEKSYKLPAALQIESGRVWGLRPKTLFVQSDTTLTDYDYNVAVLAASSVTITLPASPQVGQVYFITHMNTTAMILDAGSNYIYNNSNSLNSAMISFTEKGLFILTYCITGYSNSVALYNWLLSWHTEG